MPILGILDSAKTGNLVTNSFDSIQTITVGAGGTLTAQFTSIPQTYKHLQIRYTAKSNRAVTVESISLRFNATGSNQYTGHSMAGNGGGTMSTVYESGQNSGLSSYITGTSANASIFGAGYIDIYDYTSTSKTKTVRSLGGVDLNGSGNITVASSMWNNTSAINAIQFLSGGTGWEQYTSFALYGVK
jgi:hypothetical protein